MPDDLDIYRSANLLIDHNGDDAEDHAADQIAAMMIRGDMDGVTAWRRILGAIKQLQGVTPAGTVH